MLDKYILKNEDSKIILEVNGFVMEYTFNY